ncbi:MAG: guanylate kinase [Elusimicrobiota bacterium]|jgi:guanylate kinase
MKKTRHGLLVVVSSGSGAGKTTLCRNLLLRRKNLVFSISATTRSPRPGERDGREYFFVSEAAFRAMRKRGELLEWADVHGQFYGTPKAFIDRMCRAGRDVLLDIDVQGALQVKRRFPEAVLIFITTATFQELGRRLRSRHSENAGEIRRRLADARRELIFLDRYDYEVVNDRIPQAVKRLETILEAESLRIRR